MTPRRYEPPSARVGDVSPESPGPVPDWAAVVAGLSVDLFLTHYVVWEFAEGFAYEFTDDEELAGTLSEILDLGFTYGVEVFAFWMTLRMCRSRSFRVVGILAALSWLIMLGDRWLLEDHGFPLWYEISLLFSAPLAFATLYARRSGGFA